MKCSNISRDTGTRIAAMENAAYDPHAVVHYPPKTWADRVFGIDWARRSYRENMTEKDGALPLNQSVRFVDNL